VLGQVVGALVIRDPTMKENPASCRELRFTADNMPASATTTMSLTPCRSWKACRTGMRVRVSALFPSNTVHLQREAGGVDQ
jgi:hypothetical protein